ncbi:MAG: hypothetical protein KDH97_22355, partial [Calditrichaeota bacterium]|nr:hypothetical protein [Calditrichota bacterium]
TTVTVCDRSVSLQQISSKIAITHFIAIPFSIFTALFKKVFTPVDFSQTTFEMTQLSSSRT